MYLFCNLSVNQKVISKIISESEVKSMPKF